MAARTFLDGRITLHEGDCLEVLPTLDADSFDACVCDPPYHLTSIVKRFGEMGPDDKKLTMGRINPYQRTAVGFMNKKWDGGDVSLRVETWQAVLRVLKPGAHLVAFGGTRTTHRMACAIEDAGFEIRDTVMWLYGSGFPKSHDVSKGIDRTLGGTREQVKPRSNIGHQRNNGNVRPWMFDPEHMTDSDVPATDAARVWEGWGTALKPAGEPVTIAMKPPTALQHLAIIFAEMNMRVLAWSNAAAPDVVDSFRCFQATLLAVANSVLENAQIESLASIGIAPCVALSFTFNAPAFADTTKTRARFAQPNARPFGSAGEESEAQTDFGEAVDIVIRLMDISTCVTMGDTSANIALSWLSILDAICNRMNKCTIATASRLTTALKTLNYSMQVNISGDTGNLSPNLEPVIIARKPLIGTVAENVLRFGTGALNIDGCRVATDDSTERACNGGTGNREHWRTGNEAGVHGGHVSGRWPANVIHDGSDEVVAAFPDVHGAGSERDAIREAKGAGIFGLAGGDGHRFGDSGSAARFFYEAKQDDPCHSTNCANDAGQPFALQSERAVSALSNVVAQSTARLALQRESYRAHNTSVSANELRVVCASVTEAIQNSERRCLLALPRESVTARLGDVTCVATPKPIGTTTITVSHSMCGRCVELATFDIIETSAEAGAQAYAKRFWYSSKADGDDRLGSKHPTVKPVDLMQYLVRLVTRRGALVLDPFAGTGTTGEAAWREGARAVLIEAEAEYVADIERRMALVFAGPDERLHASIKARGKVLPPGPLFE